MDFFQKQTGRVQGHAEFTLLLALEVLGCHQDRAVDPEPECIDFIGELLLAPIEY